MDKENEVDMNLIQEVLPDCKLYVVEEMKEQEFKERTINYDAIKRWKKR